MSDHSGPANDRTGSESTGFESTGFESTEHDRTGPAPFEPERSVPEQLDPEQLEPARFGPAPTGPPQTGPAYEGAAPAGDQAAPATAHVPPGPQVSASATPVTDRVVKPGPRTGPIVWGALVLAFCGYVAQRVFGSGASDTGWWVAATIVGLGALLLVVGIVVVIRGARSTRR
ncbi:hypothetical protein [Leucobacter sp. gxy201]|uniref:hypothetical protein n=1 Tax=Leucobacter sp. gxy201 TaxID=2957200 RepID=UPI003DA1013C